MRPLRHSHKKDEKVSLCNPELPPVLLIRNSPESRAASWSSSATIAQYRYRTMPAPPIEASLISNRPITAVYNSKTKSLPKHQVITLRTQHAARKRLASLGPPQAPTIGAHYLRVRTRALRCLPRRQPSHGGSCVPRRIICSAARSRSYPSLVAWLRDSRQRN